MASPARSWVVKMRPTRPRAAWLWLVCRARVLLPESMVPVKKWSSAIARRLCHAVGPPRRRPPDDDEARRLTERRASPPAQARADRVREARPPRGGRAPRRSRVSLDTPRAQSQDTTVGLRGARHVGSPQKRPFDPTY